MPDAPVPDRFCYSFRLKPILKPTDPIAALLSWACIVAVNQYFVLPRNIGSTSAFSSLGQVRVQRASACALQQLPYTQ
jgi:hypothetical protein